MTPVPLYWLRAAAALSAPALGGSKPLLRHMAAVGQWLQRRAARIVTALLVLAALPVAVNVIGNLATLHQQRPFEQDEVPLLAVAAAYRNGQPMYPAASAPAEYGVLYGPLTFLIDRVPMALGAVQFGWFQLWSATAILGVLLFAWAALRGVAGPRLGWLALGYVALLIGIHGSIAWAVRADAWALLCFAIAFFAAVRLRPALADAIIAAAAAAAIALKVVLLLPAILPFVFLWERDGRPWPRRIAAPLLVPALALLPFALPRVSLQNYRHELLLASHHGFSLAQLRSNVVSALANLLLPLLASAWAAWAWNPAATQAWLRRRRWSLLLLTVSCGVLAASGAKHGAGAWHLLPLCLPVALLSAELWTLLRDHRDGPTLVRAFAPALCVYAVLYLHGMANLRHTIALRLHDQPGLTAVNYPALQQDLLRLVAAHPADRMQVGESGAPQFNLTWVRQVLPLRGQPLFLDPNTQNENDAAGQPYAPALLQALADCRVTLWLIPRGAEPFSMRSPYAAAPEPPAHLVRQPQLFPPPFPQIFFSHYHPVPSDSPYFDLWACNAPSPAGS